MKSKNYIRILTNKKRISLLPHIDVLFEQMKSQNQSYQDVVVTSAFPLTESQEEKIAKKVEQRLGQSVRMQIQIDSELVGGGDCKSWRSCDRWQCSCPLVQVG